MEKNNIVGMLLMMLLLVGYSFYSSNRAKQLKVEEDAKLAEQARKDSIEQALHANDTELITDSLQQVATTAGADTLATQPIATAVAAQTYVLENDVLRLTLSNQGGRIDKAELLKYDSYQNHFDETSEGFVPVTLYNSKTSKFNWNVDGVNTEKMTFAVNQGDDFIEFTNVAKGITQRYEFNADNQYLVDYTVEMPDNEAELEWDTHFMLQERGMRSDREFTFLAYKTEKGKFKKIKKQKENVNQSVAEPLDYIVQRQRFFNQTLLSKNAGAFTNTKFSASYDNEDQTEFTKLLETETEVQLANGKGDFEILIAPNERDILRAVDKKLPNMQPAGVFGLTKAFSWLFNFFRPMFSNYGLLILLMTLLIKLILTPLTYRSYLSQAKMSVLKPELAELKEKYGDDQARMSQEQMKLYNKAGVNPLGGCVPSLIQIPIFFSLYYFFRSSIFFRQKEFLWAKDLSTYDAVIDLPFKLPLLGDHISLFAILYGVALFFSMQMNKGMMTGGMPTAPSGGGKDGGNDMQAMMQTQMKIMQYGMPIFLPVIFNAFPAALTFYYFCYNVINALQTLIIKKFVINEDKIHREIQENKAKPEKKKSGFRQRLDEMMREQQEMQRKQQNKK